MLRTFGLRISARSFSSFTTPTTSLLVPQHPQRNGYNLDRGLRRARPNLNSKEDVDREIALMKKRLTESLNVESSWIISAMSGGHVSEEQGYELLNVAKQAGALAAYTYNTLIGLLCRNGNFSAAFNALDEMLADGIRPITSTYNTLISALLQVGDTGLALTAFERMKKDGSLPNETTFRILLDYFGEQGNMELVADVLEQLQQEGITQSVTTYNSSLSIFSRHKKPERFMEVLSKMVREGIKRNLATYNILLRHFMELQQFQTFTELYKNMLDDKFSPNDVTRSILMDLSARFGNVVLAEELSQ